MSIRRKILLATPAYGDVTSPFYLAICDILRTDLGVDIIPSVTRGTYISDARDKLVIEARAHTCDDILFIDVDVQPSAAHAARILSHDVEIVAGCYTKRVAGPAQWPFYATGEAQKGDLVPCNAVAAGFLRVKMHVFDALDAKFPFRRYQHDGEPPQMSYFPMMLAAKGSHLSPAEAKLEAISAVLSESGGKWEPDALLAEIVRLMRPVAPENVENVGDDCSFSRMCRAAGFTVWADSRCLLPHWGAIAFPAQQIPL